ncbi:MAG: exosortase/archaeosortase family protein [Paludibacteraceae bacterium]|nr:exosortase/archaeosortase family protein [Paludibacteraceae bacterium]
MNNNKIKLQLSQYQDIIRFVVCIVFCHLFWKLTLTYNETDLTSYDIRWFGLDISAPFIALTKHVAYATYLFLSLFEPNIVLENTRIVFQNNQAMNIVWACSGLKQMVIFSFVIICSRGDWRHKLWFIPLGLLACHVYNILRIAFLGWIVEYHQEQFDFYHEYITKYLFYGIIFLLWVCWNEHFNKSK